MKRFVLILLSLLLISTTASTTVSKTKTVMRRTTRHQQVVKPLLTLGPSVKVKPVVANAMLHYYKISLSYSLQRFTYDTCVKYEIATEYPTILALMWQESNYTSNLISKTHDYGLMQINIGTQQWLTQQTGVTNYLDPKSNIIAGVYMYSVLHSKFVDTSFTLMAYNLGATRTYTKLRHGIISTKYSRNVLDKLNQLKAL